jgi:serine/threonine-protein kinase RsbW
MDEFHVTLPADVALLASMRRSLSAWLEGAGVADPSRADLVLATHEAVANAMEHSGSADPVEVDATFDFGGVTVDVRDTGTWRTWRDQDANPERGRGLPLITALVADVAIFEGASGTTLRLVEHA